MTDDALVIGGGPAGLMAADRIASAGFRVILTDAKPTLGRKFLMAGKSGLNITRDQPIDAFTAAYDSADWLAPMVAAFGPSDVTVWMESLGQSWFTGSTGRVFPKGMKASPILRAWIQRLTGMGVDIRTRWHWLGPDGTGQRFDTPDGVQVLHPRVTILALGGASWARLGSDGAWAKMLSDRGVAVTPFAPANVGLRVDWSDHMRPVFGAPLKSVRMRAGDLETRGEAVITRHGLEGGGIYTLSPALRDGVPLIVNLFPDTSVDQLTQRLANRPASESGSNRLKKALRLDGARLALALECARPLPRDPAALARVLTTLKIPHQGAMAMDQAISTAGGIARAALTRDLRLPALGDTYACGEMLDWEAPTGGYLLTACLATGRHAGDAAARALGGEARDDHPL